MKVGDALRLNSRLSIDEGLSVQCYLDNIQVPTYLVL